MLKTGNFSLSNIMKMFVDKCGFFFITKRMNKQDFHAVVLSYFLLYECDIFHIQLDGNIHFVV